MSEETNKKTEPEVKTPEDDSAGVIAIPPLILIAFIGLGVILHNIFPLHFIHGPLKTIIGAIFLAYSVLVMSLAILQLRKAGTNIDVRKPTTAVVTDGIYRYTRNPIYVSMVLLMIAISVLVSNIWIFVLSPAFAIVMQKGVIEREERYLEKKFGTEYTDYKKRTRRWILIF